MSPNLTLSPEQIRSWQRDGYFLSDLRLDVALLEDLGERMERTFHGTCENERPRMVTWRPGDPANKIRQAAFSWRTDPVIRSAVLTPAIGYIAAQLTQSPVIRLLMDWMIHKPGVGSDGPQTTGVGWHQDQNYWRNTYPQDLLTARIPLDRETDENGCMHILPGSHRWGLLDVVGDGFWNTGDSKLPREIEQIAGGPVEEKVCEIEPGQIMFHHCLMIHKTGQNRTDRPRRSINIHLMPGHVRFVKSPDLSFIEAYAGDHGMKLHHGQMLSGPLFPTLFSAGSNETAGREAS